MEGNDSSGGEDGRGGALKKLSSKLNSFLTDARTIKTGQYLISLAHLCHLDTELAHHVWIDLFPRVWTALSDAQREVSQRDYNYALHRFLCYMCMHVDYVCDCVVLFIYLVYANSFAQCNLVVEFGPLLWLHVKPACLKLIPNALRLILTY